jgi:hypothetical protein
MKQIIIISLTIACFFSKTQAQSTFKGSIVFGMNASQINGDNSAGYNKFGLTGGVQVSIMTSEIKYWTTGILYSERGSQNRSFENSGVLWKIRLPYIEVPLMFNIKDWKSDDSENAFYRMHAGLGLSYGRLFNPRATTYSPWLGREQYFRKNNISWVAEATLYKNAHFGIGMRYTRDILRIFQKNANVNSDPQVGHFITLRGVYTF